LSDRRRDYEYEPVACAWCDAVKPTFDTGIGHICKGCMGRNHYPSKHISDQWFLEMNYKQVDKKDEHFD